MVDNLGYLINDVVYHPGDSLVVPDGRRRSTRSSRRSTRPGRSSPRWSTSSARSPRAGRTPCTTALLNDNGLGVLDRQYTALSGTEYQRLEPGTRIDA